MNLINDLPHVQTLPDAAAVAPCIVGVGTANTPDIYTQQEVLDRYGISDRRIRSVFLNGGIRSRHLYLPPRNEDGSLPDETQGQLLSKHTEQGVRMGAEALLACLASIGAELDDVGYLCCVTTTGFLTPGLSALIIRHIGLRQDCGRLDVVGMGCNAGLNGLGAVNGWARTHPGKLAILLCVEVCSAAYVFDGTMENAVVNSLFGDGAAAIGVVFEAAARGPRLMKFASRVIPEAVDAMRYDWNEEQKKFSFYLDRDVPYVVGANANIVVNELLHGSGLRRSDISHWIIHSGGKKVIDSVRINLGLSRHDVRHTTNVLAQYGNMSSGSFLFSYARLLGEGQVRDGEYGIMMTMGPGSTIETALIHWQ